MTTSSSPGTAHGGRIVLASGSRYRAGVLRDAGWDVEVDPPDVDERAADGLLDEVGPEGLALELARRKLADVAPRHPGRVVLAADQVGVLTTGTGHTMLTKQEDPDAAVEQLWSMSGTTHRLVNGVVVSNDGGGTVVEGVDVNEVTMRRFSRDEAAEYVQRFRPFDTSGSYRLEDGELMAPLAPFVVGVVGQHPSGVVGLPLPLLERLIREVADTVT